MYPSTSIASAGRRRQAASPTGDLPPPQSEAKCRPDHDREGAIYEYTKGLHPESKPAYRRDIDGLRAIAVTSVVLFHAALPFIKSGFVGVDIFFVISGYLIGGIVYRDACKGSFTFRNFYERRIRRIIPALSLVLAISLVAGLFLLTRLELKRLIISSAASLFGAANLYFFHQIGYFAPDARLQPMLMAWSLGVEEQFYIAFPVLLLILRRFAPRAILPFFIALTAASFGVNLWMTEAFAPAAYYLPPARAWELGIGVSLAIWQSRSNPKIEHQQVISLAGLVLIAVGMLCLDETTPFPGWAALLPVLGTAAVIMTPQSWFNRTVLSSPPFVGIGLISYSWYLWHWPMMAFLRVSAAGQPPLWALLIAAALSLAAAWLSWRFVELPFRAKSAPTTSIAARRAMILACGLGAMVTGAAITSASYRHAPDLKALESALAHGPAGACLVRYGVTEPNLAPPCVERGRKKIALLGDSHASAAAPAIRSIAHTNGFAFEQLTKSSCPLLLNTARLMPVYRHHAAECLTFNQDVLAQVAADSAVRVVVMTAYWSAPLENSGDGYVKAGHISPGSRQESLARLSEGLRGAIEKLQRSGKRVVVLGDPPGFAFDPAQRMLARAIPARHWLHDSLVGDDASDIAAPVARADTDQIVRTVAAATGAGYYNPAAALCASAGCRFGNGQSPYYVDSQHLSAVGSAVAYADAASLITENKRPAQIRGRP